MRLMPSLRIAVVGGSIAGCCTAAALLRAGHQVEVFERSASALVGQGVAIGLMPQTLRLLLQHDLVDETLPRFAMRAHVLLGKSEQDEPLGRASGRIDMPAWSVNWADLHANLRRRVPNESYHAGVALSAITDTTEASVELGFSDGSRRSFDLAVFADGYASLGRANICPEVAEPEYRGYVLWRGVLDVTKLVDPAPFAAEIYRISYQGAPGHAIAYRMPSGGGEVDDPGVVNFGCYRVVSADELPDMLLDPDRLQRGAALRGGALRREAEQAFKAFAREQLPGFFAEIMSQARDTFVQPIFSARVPRQRLQRVCLVGDAAALVQPFTGSGVLRALNHALGLARRLRDFSDVDGALATWDTEQCAFGRVLSDLGEQMEQALVWNAPNFATFDAASARQWWQTTTSVPRQG